MNKKAINSILETKASGNFDISKDLELPDGKSIAELLYDQENCQEKNNKNNET